MHSQLLITLFSYDHRVCAGSNIANNTIWIAARTTLSMFHIMHTVDQHAFIINAGFAHKTKPGFFK
jgi:hypothetical protein